MDNSLRQQHPEQDVTSRDNLPRKADDKFEEEIRVDSGLGTLSSEFVPEELANLIGANNLTADDIEKAFNTAAFSTSSDRKTENENSGDVAGTKQINSDSKVLSDPVQHSSDKRSTKHAKQQRSKVSSGSANTKNTGQKEKKSRKPEISVSQLIADAFKQDDDGDTDLHLAIVHSYKQVTRIIISLAKSTKWLEIKNNLFQTPLYLASLTNQPDIVRLLLNCGVRPELRNSKGYTPLHIAAKFGHVECIEELLQGCESNSFTSLRDYNGDTALHLAAKHDQARATRVLLHWGVDPNEEDDCSGYTALHLSTMSGCSAVVRELLRSHITDPNQPSFAGVMPLDMAKYYYYPTIIRMLEDAGAMESDKDINRWVGDDTTDSEQATYELFRESLLDDGSYDKIILLS